MTSKGKLAQAKAQITELCEGLKKMNLIERFVIQDEGTHITINIQPVGKTTLFHSTESL